MIRFDPKTCQDWQFRQIETLSIELITSGCEGTSLDIHENRIIPGYQQIAILNSQIGIYAHESSIPVLTEAYITHAGSKWILKSKNILTRCGCGKSFSLNTGNTKIDTIRLLKSKLARGKNVHIICR